MAIIEKNYLDLTGLSSYDTLLKTYIDSPSTKAIKKVIWDGTAEKIKFYVNKDAVATDTADFEVEVSSADVTALKARVGMSATLNAYQSKDNLTEILNVLTAGDTTVGSVTNLIAEAVDSLDVSEIALTAEDTTDLISIYGIAEVNGKIQKGASKVTLAKVAKTGAAADVSYTPAIDSDITATNVQDAITEVETDYKAAIAALDTTSDVGVASKSGKIVTITGSVKEENGIIAKGTATDIALAGVASTGKAEDVSIDDTAGKITATTVEGALGELADLGAAKTVYFTDNTDTTGTDYATIYKLYQGSTGSAASPVAGELIGTINIPKDQFVNDADLVNITYNDGKLYDGATDVTELIKGTGGTATADDAGKYFKIVFELSGTATKDKATIYISVKELSHVYTGGTTAEATVSVDTATDVITVTINNIASSKITYSTGTVEGALDRIDGADTVTGSFRKGDADTLATAIGANTDVASANTIYGAKAYADNAVTTAVEALDGSATIASVSGDTITIKGGISEADGVVGNASGDDVTISPIASASISALFA